MLLEIINKILLQGTYPELLKIPITVPIDKAGVRHELGNYGLIALIPVLGRILETIVARQLEYFL